jgi:Fe-S-cluster containining protein
MLDGSGTWRCLHQCGACCRLAPEERPEALEALDDAQRQLYLEMAGPDGWCRHYDSGGRRCRIYEERPDFCRVSNLADLFAVEASDAEAFAIACCRQQIRSVHGGRSLELRKFNRALRAGDE